MVCSDRQRLFQSFFSDQPGQQSCSTWLVGWLVGWVGGWVGGWVVGWLGENETPPHSFGVPASMKAGHASADSSLLQSRGLGRHGSICSVVGGRRC